MPFGRSLCSDRWNAVCVKVYAGCNLSVLLHTSSQACCSIFNNDGYWYRSEVVSITSFDIVEVLYVDYGNSAQVPLASVRRPKAHYLILPAQSLNCRLANLKPAGSVSFCLVVHYIL